MGSTRIFCLASPNLATVQVFEDGANNTIENGGGDDVLLGTGYSNAQGVCESSPGIAINPALVAGNRIYVWDPANGLFSAAAVARQQAVAPVVSSLGLLLLVAMLSLVPFFVIRRQGENG